MGDDIYEDEESSDDMEWLNKNQLASEKYTNIAW